MLHLSTIRLLRFPFSFFLMPVFWFALSMHDQFDAGKAILLFFILHLLVYPSSNGYNSYMDRDTDSIGGIEKPPEPLKELFIVSVAMDLLAIILALQLSGITAILLSVYIIFSRLYSYRGVRLKQYPVTGYLTVVFNQGTLVFALIYLGVSAEASAIPVLPMIAAALLIGGFYPITQIYQHDSDKKDGVNTISMLLGIKGTFIFCAIVYSGAFSLLFFYFKITNQLNLFFILQAFFLPVILYFINWAIQVWKDPLKAGFHQTMKMNWVASACSNAGFITLLILKYLG